MLLALLCASFQSLPPLPTSKLGPSGADFQWVVLCTFYNPVGLSNELSFEAGSFSHWLLNPPSCVQSEGCGFSSTLWSPGLYGLSRPPGVPLSLSALGCGTAHSTSHLAGSANCRLAHPAPQSAASLGPPAATLPGVLSIWLPCLHPSYRSELMFLYLLGCQISIQFHFLSVLVVFCF